MTWMNALLTHGAPAADELRVAFVGEGAAPSRHAVTRGGAPIGWLLDWTVYPKPQLAERDPVLGLLMRPQRGVGQYTYGAAREDGEEIDDAWLDKASALEALAGEPIEVRSIR